MSLEQYEKLVPESIVNGTAPAVKIKPKKTSTSISKHSNFIVTINPNISEKQTDTPEARRELGGKLLKINAMIKERFQKCELLKKRGSSGDDWKCPVLEDYKTQLEQSEDKGWIHSHALVSFAGEVHIDVNSARAMIKEMFPNGFHFDVKYFRDTKKIVEHYVGKQQILKSDEQQTEKPKPLPLGHRAWSMIIPQPTITNAFE